MKTKKQYPSTVARERKIIALDGEGKNIPLTEGIESSNQYAKREGWHSYTLLVAADDERNAKWLQADYARREADDERPRNYGIPTTDVLDFILSLPADAVLVGFYFSYDVVKILADMPTDKLAELADDSPKAKREKRESKTVWGQYVLEYRPRKFFKVGWVCESCAEAIESGETPTHGGCWKFEDKYRNGRLVSERQGIKNQRIVWDIYGFFQKSFVKALEDAPALFDTSVVERIADMKSQREEFDHLPDDKIREYCIDECQYLAILFRDMLTHIEDLGYEIRGGFHGAGALASAYYRKRSTKKYVSNAGLSEDVAFYSYFGGRFEI